MKQRPDRAPDWQDRHRGDVAQEITSARQAFETAFERLPRWVDIAMGLRDRLVARFGLVTARDGALDMTTLPVLHEDPDRFEIGLADRHLSFSLETLLRGHEVAVTTRIWFHHWSGRLYLAVVLIPHKLIVRHIVRSLA